MAGRADPTVIVGNCEALLTGARSALPIGVAGYGYEEVLGGVLEGLLYQYGSTPGVPRSMLSVVTKFRNIAPMEPVVPVEFAEARVAVGPKLVGQSRIRSETRADALASTGDLLVARFGRSNASMSEGRNKRVPAMGARGDWKTSNNSG